MSSAWTGCWLPPVSNQCLLAHTQTLQYCYESCACLVTNYPVQLCLHCISKGMQHCVLTVRPCNIFLFLFPPFFHIFSPRVMMAVDRWVRPETTWSLVSTSLCKPRSTRRTRASGCAVAWSLCSSSSLSLLWLLSDHGDMSTISQPHAR